MTEQSRQFVLLLGGSFNPPHIGHLRIALECREALLPRKTLFIPAASPPHKPDARLLPFSLRAGMLRACLADLPREWNLEVCEIENERAGPSYTVDTLAALTQIHAGKRLVFVMGGEDYSQLSSWRRWRELAPLADIAVAPRTQYGRDSFEAATRQYWPGAESCPVDGADEAFALPGGGRVFYLSQPLLQVSSSLLRERFVSGRSLDFLIPAPGLKLLLEQRLNALALWGS